MSWFAFTPYVSVAKRRANAAKLLKEWIAKGEKPSPVQITGSKLATTFWGKAWLTHLESLADMANRLTRGRAYVRHNSVLDLQLTPGKIFARVLGSEARTVYKINIDVVPLGQPRWTALLQSAKGQVNSLLELLSGKLSAGVIERLTRKDDGLFPLSKELKISCSCPDGAVVCKHVAAVLYGVGHRLDRQPELLFVLRQVDAKDLLVEVEQIEVLLKPTTSESLLEGNLEAIFGMEIDTSPVPQAAEAEVEVPKKPIPKKPRKTPEKTAAKKPIGKAAKSPAKPGVKVQKPAVKKKPTPGKGNKKPGR